MEKNMAVLMADLSGYSAMTEIHGGQMAAHIIQQYERAVMKSLINKSYLAERVGDQVVIMSDSADDIARTALALLNKVREMSRFLPVHAGLHYGNLLELNGRYYGSIMNVTARIAALAQEEQVLASGSFVNALKEPRAFSFLEHGFFNLKNIMGAVEILELSKSETSKFTDLVCRMQLDSDDVHFSINYNGSQHYFCSEECLHLFDQNRDVFLNLNA